MYWDDAYGKLALVSLPVLEVLHGCVLEVGDPAEIQVG
jgi:hypothetical protein